MGSSCNKLNAVMTGKVSDKSAHKSAPELTEPEKAIVRETWQVLKLHIANVGVMTFVGMFESRPELIKIFANFRGRQLSDLQQSGLINAHALRVMATVDKCVSRMDDQHEFVKILREVASVHKLNEVPVDQIKSILPHFLAAIKPHIDSYWTDDVASAWKQLFSLIIFHISGGHDCSYS